MASAEISVLREVERKVEETMELESLAPEDYDLPFGPPGPPVKISTLDLPPLGRPRNGSLTSLHSSDFAPSAASADMGGGARAHRTASMSSSFSHAPRNRAASMVSNIVDSIETKAAPIVAHFTAMWVFTGPAVKFGMYFNRMRSRLTRYMIVMITLSLVIFSSGQGNTLASVSSNDWYAFSVLVFLTDFITASLDHLLFYMVDNYWCGDFQYAYTLHAFKGPVGVLGMILVVSNLFIDMSVPKAVPNLNAVISTCIVILICYGVKNYIQHVYYIGLLERRFMTRLVKLDRHRHILSTLATHKISAVHGKPKWGENSTCGSETNETPPSAYPWRPLSAVREHEEEDADRLSSSSSSVMDGSPVVPREKYSQVSAVEKINLADISSSANSPTIRPFTTNDSSTFTLNPLPATSAQPPAPLLGSIQTSSGWRGSIPFLNVPLNSQKVKDVFAEIVANDAEGEDEESAEVSERRLFWTRMKELNEGSLRVMTYNGLVRINKRKQAKIFGRRLYVHLSRDGKYTVTAKMLREAVRKFGTEKADSLLRPRSSHGKHSSEAVEQEINALVSEAESLFILGSDGEAEVDEKAVVAAVLMVYKEMTFATSSLYDFGGLQRSFRNVIDVFFWTAMAVIIQFILQFDLITVLAPGITVILVLSFALGPFFGNMFLSIAFVFFMLPFDIGDRVMIGMGTNKFTCYITSIGLLHTTVLTIYNEKLVIPNHSLFSERIYNCTESEGATYEIMVNFPFDGPARCTQEKIDEFVEMLSNYCVVENKDEWTICWPIFSGVDVSANKVTYSFWLTHRLSTHHSERVLDARTNVYKKIRLLAHELEISFTAPVMPVYTLAERRSSVDEEVMPPFHLNSERHRNKID